jgi:mannose-1-phosphate guanylyltransferase
MLGYLRQTNVIVQPHNRGTAHGILLPLLRIAEMDPEAVVVVLPADHHLRDEETMIASLREASELASANPASIYLLGLEPGELESDLGYILPATRSRAKPTAVLRFIEKPALSRARSLIDQGALWNSFIMAASVRTFLNLFDRTFETAVQAMQSLEGAQLDEAYQHLRAVDFSRDILPGNESALQVLPVPECGWTDLGTPARVEMTLRRLFDDSIGPAARPYFPTHLNLADQCLRLQRSRADGRRTGAADLHA